MTYKLFQAAMIAFKSSESKSTYCYSGKTENSFIDQKKKRRKTFSNCRKSGERQIYFSTKKNKEDTISIS